MARATAFSPELWIDLETTAIDPDKGDILEIAWMVRHHEEDQVEFHSSVIVPDYIRLAMDKSPLDTFLQMYEKIDPYVQKMHEETGLKEALVQLLMTEDVNLMKQRSLLTVSEYIYQDLLACEQRANAYYLEKYGENPKSFSKKNNSLLLAGNSIHFDRAWLEYHLPTESPLAWPVKMSHQCIDVTSLNMSMWSIAGKQWAADGTTTYPPIPEPDGKSHRALFDIQRAYANFRHFVA